MKNITEDQKKEIIDKLISKYMGYVELLEAVIEIDFDESVFSDSVDRHRTTVLVPCHKRIMLIANRLEVSEEEYMFQFEMMMA